ncbi:MAG: hypothetical protein IIY20_03790 [Bifidobacteriaceae bacterium]|nr:hypothetical protein [Bifidobacteriaceae bacterium]
MFYFIAYYPGSFSDDSINQYEQAESNRYSDWHPAIHTLLAFKLPLVLSAGRADSIVLFQIICFSAALGYAFNAILKHAGAKYAAVSAGFVLLNPQTGYIMLFPWKDNAFATGAVLLSAYCLRIFFTKGQWLEKTANAAAFAVAACLTTLFRHNAILFTGPLIFAVIFCILRNNMLTSPPKDEKESNAGSRRKICALKNIAAGNIAVKNTAIICISIFAICLSITGPLYSALGVENPGQRQVETLGLPMNVIGAAVTYTPNALDEQTREFAYKVAPREVWEEKYVCGSYNPVKWDSRTNNDIIEEYGSQRVVSMMFRAMKSSKKATAKALIKLTEAAYTVTDDYDDFIKPHISKNDFGLSQKIPARQPRFARDTGILSGNTCRTRSCIWVLRICCLSSRFCRDASLPARKIGNAYFSFCPFLFTISERLFCLPDSTTLQDFSITHSRFCRFCLFSLFPAETHNPALFPLSSNLRFFFCGNNIRLRQPQ